MHEDVHVMYTTYKACYMHISIRVQYIQSNSSTSTRPLFNLHTRDCTGRESSISTSTESLRTRGESLMNDTSSGGTTAGTAITTCSYTHKHFTLSLLANLWAWCHPQGSNELLSLSGNPHHPQQRCSKSDFLMVTRPCWWSLDRSLCDVSFTEPKVSQTQLMCIHTFVLGATVEGAEYVLRWSVSLTVDSDMSTGAVSSTFQQKW